MARYYDESLGVSVMPKGTVATPDAAPDGPDTDDIEDDDEKPLKNKNKGGGDGTGRNQLITGLINTLPADGAEWNLEERHRWLTLAAGIFEFVYKTKDANGSQRVLTVELKAAK